MPEYKLYCLDPKGHITRRIDLECPDDDSAAREAEAHRGRLGMELWRRDRLVKHFPPNDAAR